jgi:hypothetical protein
MDLGGWRHLHPSQTASKEAPLCWRRSCRTTPGERQRRSPTVREKGKGGALPAAEVFLSQRKIKTLSLTPYSSKTWQEDPAKVLILKDRSWRGGVPPVPTSKHQPAETQEKPSSKQSPGKFIFGSQGRRLSRISRCTARNYFAVGAPVFLAGYTTSQDLLCHVGTPSLGRIQRLRTSHATKTSVSPIHWFIFSLDSTATARLAAKFAASWIAFQPTVAVPAFVRGRHRPEPGTCAGTDRPARPRQRCVRWR